MLSKVLVIFKRNYPTMIEFDKLSTKSNIVELSRSPAQKPEENNCDFNEYFLKEALNFSFLLKKTMRFPKACFRRHQKESDNKT